SAQLAYAQRLDRVLVMGPQPQTLSYQFLVLPFKAVQILPLDERRQPIRVPEGIRTASGFIRREAHGLFLYTCWHVATGIDMNTRKPPPAWTRPMWLRARLQSFQSPQPGVEAIGGLREVDIPLYDGESPRW